MSDYSLNLLALLFAFIGQAAACGLALEQARCKHLATTKRIYGTALATASGLLALHHGNTLELALNIGLYDLHQSLLAAAAGLLNGLALLGLRRQD